ncbi:hypothetical protein [Paraurantiacibacter namhicola]|uniref:Uncharacterized protein n=1 Tax=Paraurantiacibacter namhicola TaxID=645517 RepID=A0A1C7DB26_9SPHN|nr:hypothetical protein [Paraurantiacibacter namhicola]ANU08493.1 hypothetical protein A6F65_02208 [Paraurantiacibacter namhicola]
MTPFLARLRQKGSSLTGTISEPDLYASGTAEATISGIVSGMSVDFTKIYRRAAAGYENPVDYVGQVLEDGARITGVWSLLHMNGTFEMVRRLAKEEAAKAVVAEEVDV